MPVPIRLRAGYYQQFDADFARDVPAEAFGGWKSEVLEFDSEHTALVSMHAWDCGTREQFPGWHRCVEYIPRAAAIVRDVYPLILTAARRSPMRVYHVTWSPVYGDAPYAALPGYRRARSLAPEPCTPPRIAVDNPMMAAIYAFRNRSSFVGEHNAEDVGRGCRQLGFMPGAEPAGEEGVAATADELFGLCQADGIDHLIYIGFTLNGCMFTSPGGMLDMSRRGLMCSTVRQATTAIENKGTARTEAAKEHALWHTALLYGFVFDAGDLVAALESVALPSAAGR